MTVLLHGPATAVALRAESLAAAGVDVVVRTQDADIALDDLARRGVVRLVDDVDPWQVDEVVRCTDSAPGASPAPGPDAAQDVPMGRVILVGGGPGDPGLLTLAGLEALRRADVIVHDRLGPLAVLDDLVHGPTSPQLVPVGKIPGGAATSQDTINDLLVEHARAGRTVVRLKGGDGFVLGRGGEEHEVCVRAGVPVTVVPGVTSAVAAPALAGIPVTHRGVAQGFAVVSGHLAPDDPRCEVHWDELARTGLTLVVLMGVATLPAIAAHLVAAGLPGSTPAAVVENGSTPRQRVVQADLASIADAAASAQIRTPAITVIGDVATTLTEAP